MKRLHNNSGFSLVEALVTVIIFSMILGVCYMMLISGSDSWEANNVRVELQQELRKAVDWVTEDLRQAGTASITDVPADGNTYTAITFRKASGVSSGTITWDASATKYLIGGTNSDQLQRQVGVQTPAVIAQNVQSVQFQRQSASADIVNVAITLQKKTPRGKYLTGKTAIQASASFKVCLRN